MAFRLDKKIQSRVKELYYTYNNEAIASCVLLAVLQKTETLDIARACLILPFLLDDRTTNYLQNIKENHVSIEDLIMQRPRLFTSFNKRYLNLMPITINSLILLNKSNKIEISTIITLKNNVDLTDGSDIGERFRKIKTSLDIFLRMINQKDTVTLYKILNIQL